MGEAYDDRHNGEMCRAKPKGDPTSWGCIYGKGHKQKLHKDINGKRYSATEGK